MKNKHLTAAVRVRIEVYLQEDYTSAEIARKLGVSKSTISREINKRKTPNGYRADIAQQNYETKRKNCKQKPKLQQSHIQKYVCKKLQVGWSPQQISGRMDRKEKFYVCKESIYQWLYEDNWAKEEKLYQYLRYGRKKRKRQKGRSVQRSKIPNRVSIDNRPKEVDKRTKVGHWEGDSVIYPYKKAINTLNELTTGIVKFTKLDRKTAELTQKAMIVTFNKDGIIAKTVTVDNGSEFTRHEKVTQDTGVQVYFADAYSSWQRGSNENANMLLRGYLPKRHNINNLTQRELDDIAEELNNRPRKRLGYLTPNEVYSFYQKYDKLPRVAVGSRI